MSGQPLAMSASKSDVMRRLGLYGHEGERIYKKLLDEAGYARDRLSNNRQHLSHYCHPQTRTPFKWDELQETARHNETLYMSQIASRETRPYYQLGRHGTLVEENWVAKWFLWHAFRYRDNRPRTQAHHAAANSRIDSRSCYRGMQYDAVRDIWGR